MNLAALNRRKKASILVVEDESIVRADLEEQLKAFGYRIAAATASGEEARRLAAQKAPDLVLMDIILAGKVDGIEAGKYIQKKLGTPVVFVTAHGDEHTLDRAKLNAPFGYVLKPFNDRELRTAIEVALFRHRAESELHRLEQWLRAILDSMEEAVMVTDKWGFVTLLNPRAAALVGCTEKKALGKSVTDLVQLLDPASRQPAPLPLSEILLPQGGKCDFESLIAVNPNGSAAPVHFSLAPMAAPNGQVTGAILKFYPIHQAAGVTSVSTPSPGPSSPPAVPAPRKPR